MATFPVEFEILTRSVTPSVAKIMLFVAVRTALLRHDDLEQLEL
jgi:hypothetical protein